MSEFELRRALRELDAPREPDHDLWPAIAARLGTRSVQPRPRRWMPLALAASAAVAIAAGSVALIGLRGHSSSVNPAHSTAGHAGHAGHASDGGDPRLAAATVVLDAAEAELEQALSQDPGSRLLTNLLDRTARQRRNLDRWGTAPSSAMETRT